jgi:hypothetical protein
VEANKRVRPDPGLQQAFGRSGCAEQSVIQDTLDACTSENVKQMEEALAVIYRQYSQGYRHPYDRQWQILDIDLTGRPCGPKAAFATSGYFSRLGKAIPAMDAGQSSGLVPYLPDDGNFNRRARSLLPLLNVSLRHLTADVDTLVALLDTSGLSVVKLARATRRRLFREE